MANFLTRAASAWKTFRGAERKYDSLDLWKEIYGSKATWAGKSVTLTTALQVSTALACGRVIAEGIAMLPWKLMQAQGRTINPARDNPLYDKLAVSPNDLQTAFEFQETMGLHLAFCGNAYVYVTTVSRRIDQLYLLEPNWVTVKYEWPHEPIYKVSLPNGKQITLTTKDVWHVRGPSWCSYTGLEFMAIARQALGLSMAIEEGQAKIQSQGVNMPGYLSVEGSLTEDQHKKLTKWIKDNHEGADNAGRSMILDKSAKWISTAMSNVDAQVLEQRRFAVEEVCRFMRVLPIMVGHSDKTATYASSEQMFLAHSMYTAGPWARRLEQSADKRLLTPDERASGLYTKLNEKAMLRMSSQVQADYLQRLTGAGIMTRNEGREALDLNPLDGLDEPLTAVNLVAGPPPTVDSNAGSLAGTV